MFHHFFLIVIQLYLYSYIVPVIPVVWSNNLINMHEDIHQIQFQNLTYMNIPPYMYI